MQKTSSAHSLYTNLTPKQHMQTRGLDTMVKAHTQVQTYIYLLGLVEAGQDGWKWKDWEGVVTEKLLLSARG